MEGSEIGGGAAIHLKLKQLELKTIISPLKVKKKKQSGPHFYANKKIGCVLFICSAEHIIMNLGHWKSCYLEGYSFSYSPRIYFAAPPPPPSLCHCPLLRPE